MNTHAQALGKLKKGKKEKVSRLKSETCRNNLKKARLLRHPTTSDKTSETLKIESTQ